MNAPASETHSLLAPRQKRVRRGVPQLPEPSGHWADHLQLTGDDAKVELTFSRQCIATAARCTGPSGEEITDADDVPNVVTQRPSSTRKHGCDPS